MSPIKFLTLGPELRVPVDAATESWGFLGQRGSGKSNGLVVIAEELYDTGVPWVAIDPKGDWWGIRSSADGKGPGLSIPVLGGLHGDIPLEPTAGAMVANLLVDEMLTAVLDVSRMSGAERSKFLIAFCHTLFDRHQAEPHVRTVIFEEAHLYIPQSVTAATAALKEATAKIPLEGRAFGLGSVTASQRSSRLHKDVLTQFSIMVAMRSPAKLDRDAIGGWIEEHEISSEVLRTLPALANGEAWVWSPHALMLAERFRFRRRRTFDSGATPKVGQAKRVPRTLADVDLAAIASAMADTVERAKDNDPTALRATIRELTAQLTKLPAVEPEVRKVDVVPQEWWDHVDALHQILDKLDVNFAEYDRVRVAYHATTAKLPSSILRPMEEITTAANPNRGKNPGTPTSKPTTVTTQAAVKVAAQRQPTPEGVTPSQLRILNAMARLGAMGLPCKRTSVAFLSGYAPGGGAFRNYVSKLHTTGFVDYPANNVLKLTAQGDAIADGGTAPATHVELQDEAIRQVGPSRGKILRVLIDAYPDSMTRDAVAQATGYDAAGGAFRNYVSKLHTLDLVDYPSQGILAASDNLFLTP